MSQSSTSKSSTISLMETRKRKIDIAEKESKRRRTKLSLKRSYFENWSQSSSESFVKCDDAQTSCTSISVATTIVPSANSNKVINYAGIASKFGISIANAKKYHDILTSTPKVSIIRTVPIKTEKFPTIDLTLSPVFKSKRRVRKVKLNKVKPEPNLPIPQINKDVNKRVIQNVHNYLHTLEAVKIKKEIILPPASPEIKCSQNTNNCSQETNNCSQEINNCSQKTNICSQETNFSSQSTSKVQKLKLSKSNDSKRWQVIVDSEDEFEDSRYVRTSRSSVKSSTDRKENYLANPFAKLKDKSVKSSHSKKKSSFWTKKFGDEDPVERRKKFLETFEIKRSERNEEDNLFKNKGLDNFEVVKTENKTEKKRGRKPGSRIKGRDKLSQESSSSETCEKSSVVSLSVNCQPLLGKRSIKVENSSVSALNDVPSSLPISFGGHHSHSEHHSSDEVNVKTEDCPQTDLQDKQMDSKDSNVPQNDNNSDDDENTLNRSFLSLDLFDSPIKSDTKSSPEKTNTTNSAAKEHSDDSSYKTASSSITKDTSGNSSQKTVSSTSATDSSEIFSQETSNSTAVTGFSQNSKSKEKPVIKSIEEVVTRTIVIPSPQNNDQHILQLNSSVNSNKFDTLKVIPKSVSLNEQSNGLSSVTSNQESKNTAPVDLESSSRSLKNKSETSKPNLNLDKTLELPNSKEGVPKVDETFDSLCQDVSQLSNNENITLYKGDATENVNMKNEKIVLHIGDDKAGFRLPMVLSNNENEAQSPQPTRRKLSLKSPLLVKSQNESNSPQRLAKLKLEIQEQSIKNRLKFSESPEPQFSELNCSTPEFSNSVENETLRLNRTISPSLLMNRSERDLRFSNSSRKISTSIIPAAERDPRLNRLSSSVKPVDKVKRDPRLNRSSSPLKPSSGIERDPRLSLRFSPVKPPSGVQSDARFNRSFSPTNAIIGSDQVPKLNRSFSPINPPVGNQRDPRLNRSLSPRQFMTTDITDPRLIRGKSRPNTPVVPDTFSQSLGNETNSTQTIVDPRLRKRKEREEAETALKVAQNTPIVEEKIGISFAIPEDKFSPNQTKKKISVFHRLGMKRTPSPEKISNNPLLNIIKESKNWIHGKESWDSDEEKLSLHPNEQFSSDEESNASPRHRKFTSERTRNNEEIKNQPLSIKDRLNFKVPATNPRASLTTGNVHMMNPRAPLTTRNVPMMNPRASLTTGKAIVTTGKRTSAPVRMRINTTEKTIINLNPNANKQNHLQRIPTAAEAVSKIATVQCKTNNNDFSLDDSIDQFYKMNALQMLKDVDNLKAQDQENAYITFGDNEEQSTKFDYTSMLVGKNNPVPIGALPPDNKTNFFRQHCYRELRRGNCQSENTVCHFTHKLPFLCKLIKQKNPDLLRSILDFAIQNRFDYFLQMIWTSIMPILQNEIFSVYEKLYQANMRNEQFIKELLDFCLTNKLHTVESFIKRISSILDKGDSDTVRMICILVKPLLTDGFCWETIRDLCQKATPPRDMIELTIIQCLKRKKNTTHINEVFDLVKNRLSIIERNKISPMMLKQFFNLVQRKETLDKEVLTTQPLNAANANNNVITSRLQLRAQSIDSVKSMESENSNQATIRPTKKNRKKITMQESTTIKDTTFNLRQPNNSPVEVGTQAPNTGESANFTEYSVEEVDAKEPESIFRDRFWKLYLAVHSINQGLKHEDYEHIWKVLDECSKENVKDELLRRSYYSILCKNVKTCERHVSEIIKQAVRNRWSSSRKSVDILFDVGVFALIDLANNELWVMALQLLNYVKILEPDEPRTDFVLISVEIYLANNDPLEALYLLQRTRLIKTNRDEWLVKESTRNDEKHRNKLVLILLKALSYADPDKAAYLFKTLMEDQYISYYPVDLPLYLDKLTLLLLLHNKEELAADICRLVMDNDLTFKKSTYQELISRMLPVDEVLTNQILEYAIHLGYYVDIQIRSGFTTVTIDTNSTEEELYLILKRLLHKLNLAVGPAIERLKFSQLKVILVFEDIPDDARLYKDEFPLILGEKYKHIRNMVNTMLATRFTPPIRIQKKRRADKFCKILSKSLVEYLKHWN